MWIARINAASRGEGMSYSSFMRALAATGVKLNRKMLARLAVEDPSGFDFLVREVKGAGVASPKG